MVWLRGRAGREAAGQIGTELAQEACRCVHEYNIHDKNIKAGQGTIKVRFSIGIPPAPISFMKGSRGL